MRLKLGTWDVNSDRETSSFFRRYFIDRDYSEINKYLTINTREDYGAFVERMSDMLDRFYSWLKLRDSVDQGEELNPLKIK